jgi:hypothetical protein
MQKHLYFILVPAVLLSACTKPSSTSGLTSEEVAKANDLSSCLSILSKADDLTMNVIYDSKTTYFDYNRYYTPSYVYDEQEKNEWGYVLGKNGVFSVSKYQDAFVTSELLSDAEGKAITSLSSFVKGFSSLTNEFDAGVKKRAFNSKANKLFLLSLINVAPTEYLNLSAANATMGSDIYSLAFNLVFADGGAYTISFTNFLSTHATDLEAFLAGGAKELTPNENLSAARDLFKGNNFNRDVLDFESGASVGTEHFLPTYFYGSYTTSVSWGLMGIDDYYIKAQITTSSATTTQEVELFGSYMFTLSGSSVSLSAGQPYNVSPSIPSKDVYNYPSNLLLWSSFEFLKEDYLGQQYTTERASVLQDFVKNYQLTETLSNAKATATSLEVDLEGMDGKSPLVTFKLAYSQGTAKGTLVFPMKDFGKANIAAVDTFMAKSLYKK